MENQQPSSLFGRNIFTDAFAEFNEEQFFESLHNQVRNKSFFHRYHGFKTTLLWLSYLFNIASALTASYAVYWLSHKITGIEILSWAVASIFLFFLEKIKRKSSSEFWQILFFRRNVAVGWLALSFACFTLSLLSSAFGVKEGTEDMGPTAELIANDSTAQDYRNQIAILQADNLKLEAQRNTQGEIYWPAQEEKKENKELIAALQLRIINLDLKLDGHNDILSEQHQQDIELTAQTLIWVTVVMEIFFECCIAWIWYYFYRAYVERRKIKAAPFPTPTPSTASVLATHIDDSFGKTNFTTGASDKQASTTSVQNSSPIGFFTDAQRINAPCVTPKATRRSKSSVQACTELPRFDQNKYVVIHEYQKGGKTYQTPYTLHQVNARINQYARELEQAQQEQLGEDVIHNRQRWLTYWLDKRGELENLVDL